MMSDVQRACDPREPVMVAWNAYKETDEYLNTKRWVIGTPEGSLWAAFSEGFQRATERTANLHEQVNPASDDERSNHVPGAGAMGAVIEYRDMIRRMDDGEAKR